MIAMVHPGEIWMNGKFSGEIRRGEDWRGEGKEEEEQDVCVPIL